MQSHVGQVNETEHLPLTSSLIETLLGFNGSIMSLTLAALFSDHGSNGVLIAMVPGI